MRVTTLEAHVCGAAVRLLTSGVPTIEGATMAERQQSFFAQSGDLALRLTREPRGHAGMTGVVLTAPERDEADAGMLFFDGAGPRAHSGHAAMAAAALAVAQGLITTPRGWLEIDSVAGTCRVETGAAASPNVLRYQGPPAAVLRASVPVALARRTVRADIAWSGTELVAIVDSEAAGVPLAAAHTIELRRTAREILEVLESLLAVTPPGRPAAERVGACAFVGPAVGTDADVRSVVVRDDGVVSRSPSASGSAAVATVLAAMHAGERGFTSRHESLSGSSWTAEVAPAADGSAIVTIVATVEVTGSCEWLDPLADKSAQTLVWM